ncbi:hypothetical protein Pmani_013162 [Petrolisthes manimaculis]|uniref:Uncharacterized protein n=1 Tax=Petrolisthes manimaculis TaxID=1843537 RepID=A0AAE1UEC5_9EUCA|nr:hypothetical protein Pmani_013162 [Petrolisthes manimaculis]
MNGMETEELSHVFMTDGDQMVTGQWVVKQGRVADSITMTSGMVGNSRVVDWCHANRPCLVVAPKIFSKDLVILADLNVKPGRLVQGIDVSEILRQVISRDTCGPIPGLTTFNTALTITPPGTLRVRGLVDSVNVTSRQLMTFSGDQMVGSSVGITYVQGDAVVAPSVSAADGLFNNFNLSTLLSNFFRMDQTSVTVRGQVTMTGRVEFTQAQLPRDITSLTGVVGSARALLALPRLSLAIPRFLSLRNLALSSEHSLVNRARDTWGWRLVQELASPVLSVVPLGDGASTSSLPRLALLPRSGPARILHYSATHRRYLDHDVVLGGECVRTVAGWEGGNFLATVHNCAPNNSTATLRPNVMSDTVQVWKAFAAQPQLLQQIPVPGVIDLQVVLVRNRRCLVVASTDPRYTQVLCQPPHHNTFKHHHNLATGFPVKVSSVQHYDPVGRAVTVVAVVGTETLSVWMFDTEQDRFVLVQQEAVTGGVWVDLVSHGSDLLLALVTEAFRGDRHAQVTIYRLSWDMDDAVVSPFGHCGPSINKTTTTTSTTTTSQPITGAGGRLLLPITVPHLVEVQVLLVNKAVEAHFSAPLSITSVGSPVTPSSPIPISASSTQVSQQLYLFVSSQDGDLTWYTQQGIHRMLHEGDLHTPGQSSVSVWRGSEGQLWVAVTAGDHCPDRSCPVQEPDFILEAYNRAPLTH